MKNLHLKGFSLEFHTVLGTYFIDATKISNIRRKEGSFGLTFQVCGPLWWKGMGQQ